MLGRSLAVDDPLRLNIDALFLLHGCLRPEFQVGRRHIFCIGVFANKMKIDYLLYQNITYEILST